jgi:NTE family protein
VAAGRLTRLHRELGALARLPGVVGALAPASSLSPSQLRALELFRSAVDADSSTIRTIGHAALAASTPRAAVMRRNVALLLGVRRWPGPALAISCVDAYSGERCIVTERAGASPARAVAASSAVPGLFAPQRIGDRVCMDGGVSGSGTHLDVLAGTKRVLVLALSNGSDVLEAMMTVAPGGIEAEMAALAATGTGTEMEVRVPESVDPDELMSPAAVPKAMAMGRRQAVADRDGLRAFWG